MALRVNGFAITEPAVRFELDRLVKFYSEHMSPEQIKEQMDALRRKACEQAIGARLLIDEANAQLIPVPQEDVEERIKEVIDSAGGEAAFNRLLEKQGITRDLVRRSIEQGRRVDLLVAKVTAAVPEPTEAEIRAHYDAHRAEFRKPDRAQARHILLRPASGGKADRQVVVSRLREIRQRIEDGAEFADEAAAHSECPSGKKTGGSIGWVSRGMTVPEFDAAIFAMEVGKLSDVVETSVGFHVIQKTGQEDGEEATFEEMHDKVHEFLQHAARGVAISAYVAGLKAKAVIEDA